MSAYITVLNGTYRSFKIKNQTFALVREKIGFATTNNAIKKKDWPLEREFPVLEKGIPIDELLPFDRVQLTESQTTAFKCGAFLKLDQVTITKRNFSEEYVWMNDDKNQLFGLGHREVPLELRPKIKFHLGELDET